MNDSKKSSWRCRCPALFIIVRLSELSEYKKLWIVSAMWMRCRAYLTFKTTFTLSDALYIRVDLKNVLALLERDAQPTDKIPFYSAVNLSLRPIPETTRPD